MTLRQSLTGVMVSRPLVNVNLWPRAGVTSSRSLRRGRKVKVKVHNYDNPCLYNTNKLELIRLTCANWSFLIYLNYSITKSAINLKIAQINSTRSCYIILYFNEDFQDLYYRVAHHAQMYCLLDQITSLTSLIRLKANRKPRPVNIMDKSPNYAESQ